MANIKSNYKNISHTAGQFIPAGVRESAIDLERLLTAYYEWSELDGNFQKESKKLAESFSSRTADDDYILFFKQTLLRLFPETSADRIRHLLKFSKLFYQSRGTPESYKFLFNVIWGANVEITFPGDKIMRTSDGKWVQRILMKLDLSDVNLLGKTIKGIESGATALISEINKINTEMTEVVLDGISKDFIIGETVHIYTDINLTLLYKKCRTVSSIGNYKIINGGLGYHADEEIPLLSRGDGSDFKIKISNTDLINGKILSLNIENSGVGYLYEPPILNLEDAYLFTTTNNKEPATIELIYTANYKEYGKYLENKSFLSDKFKLYDGEYYQDFSYVVNTSLDYDIIKGPIKELLHPAGTKMFYKKEDNKFKVLDLPISKISVNNTFNYSIDNKVRYNGRTKYNDENAIYTGQFTNSSGIMYNGKYSFDGTITYQ